MGVIVAIDGPAGAGKSSVAGAVADRLGFVRVDTGALYRAVTLLALERGLSSADASALEALTSALDLRFDGGRVLLEGRDVTDAIRSREVTAAVSAISAVPQVRRALLGLQRRLGRAHPSGAILEGRDIGTVVFPDAEVKVFLTASDEERARRRHAELVAAGRPDSYEDVLDGIRGRDAHDAGRRTAPLKPAESAVRIDTTEHDFEQVVQRVLDVVRRSLDG